MKQTPRLERSFKAATKRKNELPTNTEMQSIPLKKLSSLAEDIYIKTREKHHKILTLICDNF